MDGDSDAGSAGDQNDAATSTSADGSAEVPGTGNETPPPETTTQATVRARLVVRAPTWTESMTLQVDGGIVRALVRNQEIPLNAGRHILNFVVDTGRL